MSPPAQPGPWLGRLLGALVAACVLAVVWASAIEPRWIEVTHHRIEAPASSHLRGPLRIAHLSDLHTTGLKARERKLISLLAAQAPDLIVVTGDTVTTHGTTAGYRAVWQALVELRAPLGVVAVRGNWEYWAAPAGSETAADEAGATTLVNASLQVRDDVWVLGLDDPLAGDRDQPTTRAGVPRDAFRLGLMHAPEVASAFAEDLDLLLAGHTHGSQIVLPLLGAPWLPPGSGKYVRGWYDEGGTPLYISRGIGTSILPIRFLCRPELAIIEVVQGNR